MQLHQSPVLREIPRRSDSMCKKEQSDLWHWELVWNTKLAIRYHMYAQSMYQKIGKYVTVVTLLSSSAALAVIIKQHEFAATFLTICAAVSQILDLVVDTKAKAILHATLRQRYLQLEVDLSKVEDPSKFDKHVFVQQRATIESEEPPLIKHLMSYCHNEQCRVEDGEDSTSQVKLSIMTRLRLLITPY